MVVEVDLEVVFYAFGFVAGGLAAIGKAGDGELALEVLDGLGWEEGFEVDVVAGLFHLGIAFEGCNVMILWLGALDEILWLAALGWDADDADSTDKARIF